MKITIEEVMAAIESGESCGFCALCGAEHWGIEPDARRYECEECGRKAVYGAEELLFRLVG